jgi:hypothetical protein
MSSPFPQTGALGQPDLQKLTVRLSTSSAVANAAKKRKISENGGFVETQQATGKSSVVGQAGRIGLVLNRNTPSDSDDDKKQNDNCTSFLPQTRCSPVRHDQACTTRPNG